ncbi:MAG: lipocalin family protein [Verrucomicrobiae bacterium]|nr:lipocalin family protein [Verrucomicrobiae bacterium]
MKLILSLLLFCGMLPPALHGQSPPVFNDKGWRLAVPGWKFEFPRDHGSHDQFQTEWWYYTGNLREIKTGRRFGYQLTFFRQGILPPDAPGKSPKSDPAHPGARSAWRFHHYYFAHFALTDVTGKKFHAFSKNARGSAMDDVFFSPGTQTLRIGDWSIRTGVSGTFALSREGKPTETLSDVYRLRARDGSVAIDLSCVRLKPYVFHGMDGVSQKSSALGNATHYFSMTRMATSGTVTLGNKTFEVEGSSWFDKEFGTNQLAKDQQGWDWLSLQLDNNEELMVYILRTKDGGISPESGGTFIAADGSSRHLKAADFQLAILDHWKSRASGARYPARWRLSIPSLDCTLEIKPLLRDQELFLRQTTTLIYWEGACEASGTRAGRRVTAQGYTELTGYAGDLTVGF